MSYPATVAGLPEKLQTYAFPGEEKAVACPLDAGTLELMATCVPLRKSAAAVQHGAALTAVAMNGQVQPGRQGVAAARLAFALSRPRASIALPSAPRPDLRTCWLSGGRGSLPAPDTGVHRLPAAAAATRAVTILSVL